MHGSAVKDGELRFLSVSAVERASACLRDWYYTYVEGKREPQGKSQARGTQLHKETADYLTTGEKNLSSQIIRGLHLLPPPGKDLFVEHSLADDLATAPLRAEGVPFVGAIDLMHERGINYGGSDIVDTKDPEGTIEVIDWKFPSKMDYAKSSNELPKLMQMAGYGTYVFAVAPATQYVRLSHGYMPVSGAPRKATLRVIQEDIQPTWDKVTSLTRSIKDAAKEKDANSVDADTRSCRRYGRVCIHSTYCTAAMHNSLSSLLGVTAANNLLKGNEMALLPKATFKPSAAQMLMMKPQVQAEMEKLKAEEAASKKAMEEFLASCVKVGNYGRGFPALAGAAAQYYAKAGGQSIAEGYVFPGNGELASLSIEDVELIPQLLIELEDQATQAPKEDVVGLLPPDAPEPAPVTPVKLDVDVVSISTDNSLASVTAEPKKRGRKKKEEQVEVDRGRPEVLVDHSKLEEPTFVTDKVYFYVDCVPLGVDVQRFEPKISQLNADLSKELGAPDIRCPSNEGPGGFGRWKGIVLAAVRETLAPTLLTGHYVLDARGSELCELVAEGMREVCMNKGWIFVRGIR